MARTFGLENSNVEKLVIFHLKTIVFNKWQVRLRDRYFRLHVNYQLYEIYTTH